MDVGSMSYMNLFSGQMSGTSSRPDFRNLDKNGDVNLDQSEFQAMADDIEAMTGETLDVEEIFSTYDTDGDGMLSPDETESAMEAYKPSGPPSGGMMPIEMMGEMGSFISDSLGIGQYEEVAAMGQSDDLVSTLLDSLSENEEKQSASDYILSIDTAA